MSMSSNIEAVSRARPRPRAVAHVDLGVHGHRGVRHALRSWQRRHRLRTVLVDTAAVLLGLSAGLWARDAVLGEDAALWGSPEATRITAAVIALLWLVLLTRHGAYAPQFIGGGNEEYRAVMRAAATLVAVVAFASFAFKLEFSRGVLFVAVPTMLAATVGARHLLRLRLAAARDRGHCLQPAVLVGDAQAVLELATRITAAPRTTGLRVQGVCVTDPDNPILRSDEFAGIPVLGADGDTLAAVDRVGAEVVAVVSGPSTGGHALRRLGWALENRDVDLLIDPGIVEVAGPRLSLRQASGLPMLHVERPVCSGVRYAAKLTVDRLLAFLLLMVVGPVLARPRLSSSGRLIGPGSLPAEAGGRGRADLHHVQVPHDVHRCRRAARRAAEPARRQRDVVQAPSGPAGHPRRRAAAPLLRSTSCPSCSTSSAARCRSSARAPLCRARWTGMRATSCVVCASDPA